MRDLWCGGVLVVGLVVGLSSNVVADSEPEFYMVAGACKGIVAASGRLNSLKGFDDDSRDWTCSHSAPRKLSCVLHMKDGASNEELSVDLDTADTLVMHSATSSYWFWIDRANHVATYTVRMVEGTKRGGMMAIGTSVCQAAYLTSDEASHLAKKP